MANPDESLILSILGAENELEGQESITKIEPIKGEEGLETRSSQPFITTPGRAVGSVVGGAGALVGSFGGMLERVGLDTAGGFLENIGQELQKYAPDDPTFPEIVLQGAGSIIPMYGMGVATTGLAFISKIPTLVKYGAGLGLTAAKTVEVSSIAGGVYQEVLEQTGDKDAARAAADKAFIQAAAVGVATAPTGILGFSAGKTIGRRIAESVVTESAEEFIQTGIEQREVSRAVEGEARITDPEQLLQAGLIGGILGAGFTGVGETISRRNKLKQMKYLKSLGPAAREAGVGAELLEIARRVRSEDYEGLDDMFDQVRGAIGAELVAPPQTTPEIDRTSNPGPLRSLGAASKDDFISIVNPETPEGATSVKDEFLPSREPVEEAKAQLDALNKGRKPFASFVGGPNDDALEVAAQSGKPYAIVHFPHDVSMAVVWDTTPESYSKAREYIEHLHDPAHTEWEWASPGVYKQPSFEELAWHVKAGRLLGYAESDIRSYLTREGQEPFDKPLTKEQVEELMTGSVSEIGRRDISEAVGEIPEQLANRQQLEEEIKIAQDNKDPALASLQEELDIMESEIIPANRPGLVFEMVKSGDAVEMFAPGSERLGVAIAELELVSELEDQAAVKTVEEAIAPEEAPRGTGLIEQALGATQETGFNPTRSRTGQVVDVNPEGLITLLSKSKKNKEAVKQARAIAEGSVALDAKLQKVQSNIETGTEQDPVIITFDASTGELIKVSNFNKAAVALNMGLRSVPVEFRAMKQGGKRKQRVDISEVPADFLRKVLAKPMKPLIEGPDALGDIELVGSKFKWAGARRPNIFETAEQSVGLGFVEKRRDLLSDEAGERAAELSDAIKVERDNIRIAKKTLAGDPGTGMDELQAVKLLQASDKRLGKLEKELENMAADKRSDEDRLALAKIKSVKARINRLTGVTKDRENFGIFSKKQRRASIRQKFKDAVITMRNASKQSIDAMLDWANVQLETEKQRLLNQGRLNQRLEKRKRDKLQKWKKELFKLAKRLGVEGRFTQTITDASGPKTVAAAQARILRAGEKRILMESRRELKKYVKRLKGELEGSKRRKARLLFSRQAFLRSKARTRAALENRLHEPGSHREFVERGETAIESLIRLIDNIRLEPIGKRDKAEIARIEKAFKEEQDSGIFEQAWESARIRHLWDVMRQRSVDDMSLGEVFQLTAELEALERVTTSIEKSLKQVKADTKASLQHDAAEMTSKNLSVEEWDKADADPEAMDLSKLYRDSKARGMQGVDYEFFADGWARMMHLMKWVDNRIINMDAFWRLLDGGMRGFWSNLGFQSHRHYNRKRLAMEQVDITQAKGYKNALEQGLLTQENRLGMLLFVEMEQPGGEAFVRHGLLAGITDSKMIERGEALIAKWNGKGKGKTFAERAEAVMGKDLASIVVLGNGHMHKTYREAAPVLQERYGIQLAPVVKPVPGQANPEYVYFPWAVDLERLHEIKKGKDGEPIHSDITVSNKLRLMSGEWNADDRRGTDLPEPGWAWARKGGGRFNPKADYFSVYNSYMNNAHYLIHMAGVIEQWETVVIGNTALINKIGRVRYQILEDFVKALASNGHGHSTYQTRILDMLGLHTGMASLTFKIGSSVLQPVALVDAMFRLGPGPVFKALAFQLGATSKGTSASNFNAWLETNSRALIDRLGDDPAYRDKPDWLNQDTLWYGSAKKKVLQPLKRGVYQALWGEGESKAAELKSADWVEYGFSWLTGLDYVTARTVQTAAIIHEARIAGWSEARIEEFMNSRSASAESPGVLMELAEADMESTQGSGVFFKQPSIFMHGSPMMVSFARNVFKFQRFVLTRWSQLRVDLWELGFIERKKWPSLMHEDPSKWNPEERRAAYGAANGLLILMLAVIAESFLRTGTREGIAALVGPDDDDFDKHMKNMYVDSVSDIPYELLGVVPVMGHLVNMQRYGSRSLSVPSMGGISNLFVGGGKTFGNLVDMMNEGAFDRDDLVSVRQALRDGILFAQGAGMVVGVPGTVQAAQLGRAIFQDKPKAKKRKGTIKPIKARGIAPIGGRTGRKEASIIEQILTGKEFEE